MKRIKITINKIRNKMIKKLINQSLPKREAIIIVDDYIEGELLGKITHGLLAFAKVLDSVDEIKNNRWQIKKNSHAYAFIDGGGYFGQVVAEKAIKLALIKAKKNGIAMVGVNNIRAFLRPGTQAEKLAKNNLIGIVWINGGASAVAPYGGVDAIFGTNPIGISIPTNNEPITLDMATSERAWGEVRVAELFGYSLPEDIFFDKKGRFTRKPELADAVLAFGGYKGAALNMIFEIFTGSLVGSNMASGYSLIKSSGDDYQKYYRGALFVAIDPSKFIDIKKFKEANTKLVKNVKKSRRRKGTREILIPGERAKKNKDKILKRGYFEIDKRIYKKIFG